LRVEIDPPDTQDVRDLMVKMKRGDIDQMSFAFSMAGGKQEWDETGKVPLRTILEVGELYDVSVVTRGAYPTTEVGVRSLDEARKVSQREQNFTARQRRIAERKARAEARFRGIKTPLSHPVFPRR
jgi:phage head maturation protease